jgi:hypothetical protein
VGEAEEAGVVKQEGERTSLSDFVVPEKNAKVLGLSVEMSKEEVLWLRLESEVSIQVLVQVLVQG